MVISKIVFHESANSLWKLVRHLKEWGCSLAGPCLSSYRLGDHKQTRFLEKAKQIRPPGNPSLLCSAPGLSCLFRRKIWILLSTVIPPTSLFSSLKYTEKQTNRYRISRTDERIDIRFSRITRQPVAADMKFFERKNRRTDDLDISVGCLWGLVFFHGGRTKVRETLVKRSFDKGGQRKGNGRWACM